MLFSAYLSGSVSYKLPTYLFLLSNINDQKSFHILKLAVLVVYLPEFVDLSVLPNSILLTLASLPVSLLPLPSIHSYSTNTLSVSPYTTLFCDI